MGLFAYAIAGGGFILIAAWESLANPSPDSRQSHGSDPSSPSVSSIPKSNQPASSSSSPSSSVFVALLSSLFIVNSLFSLFNSLGSQDRIGSVIQFQVLAIAAVFLLYSILGLLVNSKKAFRLPSSIINLILLFGFVEEFLLFYLQKKDTSGIENRYYDLLLVPISICVFSTVLELKYARSSFYPRLARAIGLVLQGTWFLQMGISFYSSLIASGCTLHETSRGNFTIKCKGHPEYHRARAIATLQFNCHLAMIVVLAVGLFSIMAKKYGYIREDFSNYRPLGADIRQIENLGNFTLDSDEDEEIKEESNVGKNEKGAVEMSANGFGSHG